MVRSLVTTTMPAAAKATTRQYFAIHDCETRPPETTMSRNGVPMKTVAAAARTKRMSRRERTVVNAVNNSAMAANASDVHHREHQRGQGGSQDDASDGPITASEQRERDKCDGEEQPYQHHRVHGLVDVGEDQQDEATHLRGDTGHKTSGEDPYGDPQAQAGEQCHHQSGHPAVVGSDRQPSKNRRESLKVEGPE